jgi:regulator of replication initiation timing
MAKQAVARTIDLDPIDRLEEKVKLLVNVITRLRAEQARTAEEHARLTQEIETLRARLIDVQDVNSELDALRLERDAIRQRVGEMLSHLEAV